MLTGAVLGALGGAGIARAFNVARGQTDETIRFDDAFVARLCADALLRYLAVAHYGRGRGEWAAGEYPPFWRDAVQTAVEREGGVASLVALRAAEGCDARLLAKAWQAKLGDIARSVLAALYPDALPPARRSAENDEPAG
jgi:hypothetical protein